MLIRCWSEAVGRQEKDKKTTFYCLRNLVAGKRRQFLIEERGDFNWIVRWLGPEGHTFTGGYRADPNYPD